MCEWGQLAQWVGPVNKLVIIPSVDSLVRVAGSDSCLRWEANSPGNPVLRLTCIEWTFFISI